MTTIPVFPLNAVLFPGVVTPLHIFEDRYRALMRDLLAMPDPADRIFAVVAIREGYEVGDRGMQSLHRVGTLVQLTEVERYDDGRFDIEVTGRQRIVLDQVDPAGEYLTAEGDLVDDEADTSEATDQAARTLATFEEYRDALSSMRGGPVLAGPMPRDPAYLSYTLAATCLLSQGERQDLLEAPDALTRLRMLRHSLREEMRAMRALPSLPATEVARTRWSPN
ncbi:MAG: LON peptidase substrate-binding domain-containing protein [Propionibacteriales bacterium]|nr:LON peptidase substrate-binding domain-containing protein [Propionibacteriales bacterium]